MMLRGYELTHTLMFLAPSGPDLSCMSPMRSSLPLKPSTWNSPTVPGASLSGEDGPVGAGAAEACRVQFPMVALPFLPCMGAGQWKGWTLGPHEPDLAQELPLVPAVWS